MLIFNLVFKSGNFVWNMYSIIGVMEMINKIDGSFTQGDEEAFDLFAVYCGLALHNAKVVLVPS